EVIAALPVEGTAIIHTGDEPGAVLARRASATHRVVRYELADADATTGADVVATAIRIDAHGCAFQWSWAAESLDRTVVIPLLGRHQVANVSAALAAVHVLGYSLDAAIAAAASLEQIEHRLQLMRTA